METSGTLSRNNSHFNKTQGQTLASTEIVKVKLTPKGLGLVIHQNHLKTTTLGCDIIRFFQTLFNNF